MSRPTGQVRVYDATGDSWWGLSDADRERFNDWARAEGVELNGRAVYRTEIHSTDHPFIRVFAYDLDEQGRKYVDPETDDVAKRAPTDHPISSMPPVEPACFHPHTADITQYDQDPDDAEEVCTACGKHLN